MAQTVIRAAQTNYDYTLGGTRDTDAMGLNVSEFVDSLETTNTDFLDSLKKGSPGIHLQEIGGTHNVMPRGSKVSAAASGSVTTIPIIPGHGTRFQQGHVLLGTNAGGESERMWVNADPATGSLSVLRGQGGDTPIIFAAGDDIRVIGIAMPQLSDFPLSPVTRGRKWWNTFQKFTARLEYSAEGRVSPDNEFTSGDWMDRDLMDKGKELKKLLNEALLLGRRQLGSQDAAAPVPGMLGGMVYFAESSGNNFNAGGSGTLLSVSFLDDALDDLNKKYGDAMGTRLLVGRKTKRVLNRISAPYKFQAGATGNTVDLRWEKLVTESGEYNFKAMEGIPEGRIFIYKDDNQEYAPFKGLDWKNKDLPTAGDWFWKGMSGTFTYRPKHADGFAVLEGFNPNPSAYPAPLAPAA